VAATELAGEVGGRRRPGVEGGWIATIIEGGWAGFAMIINGRWTTFARAFGAVVNGRLWSAIEWVGIVHPASGPPEKVFGGRAGHGRSGGR
jgi:hypothetical protein